MANILALPGPNSKYRETNAKPAAFWAGFWHGLLINVTFLVSLFTSKVRIYETLNKGRLYDLGFLLGIWLISPTTVYIGTYRML